MPTAPVHPYLPAYYLVNKPSGLLLRVEPAFQEARAVAE